MERLLIRRLWVQIPAPDTGWTIFTYFVVWLFETDGKLMEKEDEDGPFKISLNKQPIWTLETFYIYWLKEITWLGSLNQSAFFNTCVPSYTFLKIVYYIWSYWPYAEIKSNPKYSKSCPKINNFTWKVILFNEPIKSLNIWATFGEKN